MSLVEQKLKALEFFKDWSNYLLIATTGALGWIAKDDVLSSSQLKSPSAWCFAISLIFAMLTLSLIPLVAEEIKEDKASIYDVKASFRLFWLWGPIGRARLKAFCWPQHIFFIIGVLLLALGVS